MWGRLTAALALVLATSVAAQDEAEQTPEPVQPEPLVISPPLSGPVVDLTPPVLILDTERLFAQSQYAQNLRDEIEAEASALNTENDRIVAELTAEEEALAARRPSMEPQDFRAEAQAFDARVQEIRQERDAKEAEINQARAALRLRFLDDVRPIVGRMMLERGGQMVIYGGSVYVAVRSVDITEEAIAEVDAELAPQEQ